MTKKEKIQEAYLKLNVDWNWISIFIDFSNGFTFKEDVRLTLPEEELEIVNSQFGIMWRPKSLQGIENNNGWIKIESEGDLPKENGKYWTAIGDNQDEMFDNEFVERKYFKWRHIEITHYQPIQKPQPPIY